MMCCINVSVKYPHYMKMFVYRDRDEKAKIWFQLRGFFREGKKNLITYLCY